MEFKFETDMSRAIFRKKYMLEMETEEHQPIERILSVVGKYFPEVVSDLREALYKRWIGPAGGIWRAADNPDKNVSSINCTTLAQIEDSLESISFDGHYWWMKFSAFGQGEGVDLSKLRPRGAKIHNTAKSSTGVPSCMITFHRLLEYIAQEGRRGASLMSLNIKHPDVPEFITMKDEGGILDTANISLQITDDFMEAVKNNDEWSFCFENDYEKIERKTNARELFKFLAEHVWKSGDPGVQFIDTAKKYSNSDYLGHPVVSTNACSFTGDTLIVTKEGVFPIKNLVGKKVTIFDGIDWVKNSGFSITGYNQDIYRVTLQSGLYFDTTEQHRFFTEKGEEKRTYELSVGDRLEYNLEQAKFEGTHYEEGAYLKGFLLGDGNIRDEGFSNGPRPQLWLYEPKYGCFNKIKESFNEISKREMYNNTITECELKTYKSSGKKRASVSGLTSIERGSLYKWCHDYKKELPNEVFNWNNKSKIELLAGLFDSDGTSFDTKKGFGYQISSINKEFLIGVLRLLSTIGIYGKLSVMKKKGASIIKGTAYDTQEVYRITIPQKYAIELAKQVSFARLKDFSKKTISYNQKFKYNKIVSIDKLDNKADKVYCTHVSSTSKFMVNSGIITGNSEQWLDPHNVCLLSSINLSKFQEYDWDGYKKLIRLITYLLDAFRRYEIDEGRSPSPIQKEKLSKLPRIGIGVTGLADYFIYKEIVYASKESIQESKKIFSLLSGEAYKASYEIAKKDGKSFEYYDKEKYKKSPFVQRLLNEGLIEDYHLDYQAHVCKTTVAPNGSLTEVMEAGGSGIEPIFAKYFTRRERATTDNWKEWYIFNHTVRREMDKYKLEHTKENAEKITNKPYWITAHDINNLEKINMMAEIQKYIDSAISVTYNLPENASVQEIEDIYFHGWEKELKGVAIYREGSKDGVLITDKAKRQSVKSFQNVEKRPETLPCDIYEMQVDKRRVIALVGIYEDRPYEIFITDDPDEMISVKHAKTGMIKKIKTGRYDLIVEGKRSKYILEDISSVFDDEWGTLSRLVSMNLRHNNVPLQFIVDQLNKTRKFGTFSKGVARTLKRYIQEGEEVLTSNGICPECGEKMIYKEGCTMCPSCMFTKCD